MSQPVHQFVKMEDRALHPIDASVWLCTQGTAVSSLSALHSAKMEGHVPNLINVIAHQAGQGTIVNFLFVHNLV